MTEIRLSKGLGWPGDMPPSQLAVPHVANSPENSAPSDPSIEHLMADALMHKGENPVLKDVRLIIAERDMALRSVRTLTSQRDSLRLEKQELLRLAYTDELTGLPNRRAIYMILDQLIEREPGKVGVMIVDLDDLKKENTSAGLAGGDRKIKNAADRLTLDTATRIVRGSLRSRDSKEHEKREHDFGGSDAARIGGDEFLVVLRGIENQDQLTVVNNRVITNLRKGGVKASTGTALHRFGMTREALIDEANGAESLDKSERRAKWQARSIRAISPQRRRAEEAALALLAKSGVSIEEFWSRRGPTSR